MLHGLLSLSDNIRQLGITYHPVNQHTIVQKILQSFITLWTKEFWDKKVDDNALYDIAFIRNVSARYGESRDAISTNLSKKLKSLVCILFQGFVSLLTSA